MDAVTESISVQREVAIATSRAASPSRSIHRDGSCTPGVGSRRAEVRSRPARPQSSTS